MTPQRQRGLVFDGQRGRNGEPVTVEGLSRLRDGGVLEVRRDSSCVTW